MTAKPRPPAPRLKSYSTLLQAPLPGVLVVRNDSAHRFPRHWHGTYGLGVIERGAQRSRSGRGDAEARAGQCITHNPGEVHDGVPTCDAGRRWTMVELAPDALARLLGGAAGRVVEWHAPVVDDAPLRDALQRAFAQLAHPRLFEEALMLALARAIDPEAAPAPHGDPRWRAVQERMADDLADAPTLDQLAALAGTSRFTLVRGFARTHGLPPMAWLQQLRLHRARDRIAAGHALADVAHACGFSDQSHLTRLFRRQFGYTPGAWQALRAWAPRATAF